MDFASASLQVPQDTHEASATLGRFDSLPILGASLSNKRYKTRSQSTRILSCKTDDSSEVGVKQTSRPPDQRKSKRLQKMTPSAGSDPTSPDISADLDSPTISHDSPDMLLNATTFTFREDSSFASIIEPSANRSRPSLPVPVPNLTKKSRGRRVPTKPVDEQDGVQKTPRLYVCQVEGCGKCFHRGEHLKRHIRSIHTHEKPFKCTHPNCDKHFNRHDNLLQHLKVHQEYGSGSPDSTPASYTAPFQVIQEHPHGSPSDADGPPDTSEGGTHTLLQSYPLYPSYTGTGAPSLGFVTNMAVSSLRTELPHSPLQPQDIPFDATSHAHYGPFSTSFHHHPEMLLAHDWQS